MFEVGSQFFEGKLDLPTREDSFLCTKQIVRIKVVWKMLDACLLTTNGIDHTIAGARWYAVVASHFRVRIFDPKPPIPFRILVEASIPAMLIRYFEMSQILKTHASVAQDKQCVPVHRRDEKRLLALFHGFLCLF